MNSKRTVFVTGGTGYLGRPLVEQLLARGHEVRALTRAESKSKLPAGCIPIVGNALDANSYSNHIRPSDTFVQLVGVPHPNPSKATQFREIDLASGSGAIRAAREADIEHFVYLSVAHPAPMMKAYIQVRAECERQLRASGMNTTILRPWYVLGPGHRWPYLLVPAYWICELLPSTRESARRLGLVTLDQMLAALIRAAETPASGIRIIEVPEIRNRSQTSCCGH